MQNKIHIIHPPVQIYKFYGSNLLKNLANSNFNFEISDSVIIFRHATL